MTIICTVCGYDQNSDGLEFCDACGAELPINTTIEPSLTPSTEITDINEITATIEVSPSSSIPDTFGVEGSHIAKLICKMPNPAIAEFSIENYSLIGIFDPDTGPVDIDLENFVGGETVSRQHGEIYWENGQWMIKDLGSTNGIFIKKLGNNRFNARITTPEIIEHGDEIAIAKIRFSFKIDSEK
ncbi:FHA domain-containing protein [Geminocystis sp. NIES-3709]|uniref:FHA domain-containing protein n=1 Tax=Geminocystis sp. NIES-3709 TaxID=1617448 RepID=UPI0005FC5513|nr:FHA domain-containing protein [Geminocystis sp. NIES-3709]BAQ66390.1 FraH-related protein [Geminocystis sp. NIES-3709]